MFDLSALQYNSAHPELIAIVYTVLLSVVLGAMLALTYEKTSSHINRPAHFLQAMILVTIVAATIMQAIGDSVARGLGMLGALSIIRFRTTVRNPRNIVFMFGAIAAGIACGVFGYVIALFGTIGFCLTAFLLKMSSFHPKENLVGTLRLELPKENPPFQMVRDILSQKCRSSQLLSRKSFLPKKPEFIHAEFELKLHKGTTDQELIEAIQSINDAHLLSLTFRNVQMENI